MPSFFESLKRVISGQPVFVPGETQKTPQSAGSPTAPQAAQNQGPKVLPTATITRVICTNNGPSMECEVIVENQSNQTLRLQRIEFLGMTDELGDFLRPGEEREYSFHFANRPTNTSRNIAQLFYNNDPEGDYFCAQHLIEFEKLADNTYSIHEFRFQPPVRDV